MRIPFKWELTAINIDEVKKSRRTYAESKKKTRKKNEIEKNSCEIIRLLPELYWNNISQNKNSDYRADKTRFEVELKQKSKFHTQTL